MITLMFVLQLESGEGDDTYQVDICYLVVMPCVIYISVLALGQ